MFSIENPVFQFYALPKTKRATENPWLEDEVSFLGWPIFRGYVSFMEGKGFNPLKWFFEIVLLIFFTHGFCGNDPI